MNTIHIDLKERGGDKVELRYYADRPDQYEDRQLSLAEIEPFLALVDTEYYVSSDVMGDAVQIGTTLYRWLDSGDRFLTNEINKASGETIALAIALGGRLAHLPWELLHDGMGFLVGRPGKPVIPVRWNNASTDLSEPTNRPLQLLFMATAPLGVQPALSFEG